MAKHVTIGLRMDNEFIALLKANVELARLRDKDQLTPSQQLALLVLAEARGAHEEQVHQCILPEWRPHIEAVSEIRKVESNV